MSTSLPPIAETISQGGRAGSVETAEDGFNLHFKPPSEGNQQGLTPEHLFGAAWAACFNGAVKYIAKESGHADEGITVTARVQLHPNGPQPFSVELLVSIPDLDENKAEHVVAKAHAMCAYSKATKGNVGVKITLD
jgi:lipoyl-dependent peroxiredoxin